MKISLDQVNEVRKRVNVDYQTAEKALRKNKNNIDQAVLYIKKKKDSKPNRTVKRIEDFLNRILSYKVIIKKDDRMLINLPLFLVIFLLLILNVTIIVLFVFLLIGILFECEFKIVKVEDKSNNEKPNVIKKDKKEKKQDKDDIEICKHENNKEVTIKVTKERNDIDDEKISTDTETKRENIEIVESKDGYNEIIIE